YPPPQAIDSDAVDQFLFVDKRGVCEHYVSAMVVMLRSLGIHTRFIVGYGSGDFNPFTGFYEVRASDAHAWTEVFFPEYGWIPFDPTPGWEPDPQSGVIKNWVFSELFGGLDLPNVSLTSAAKFGWRAFKAVFPAMITLLPFIIIAAGLYRLWRIFCNYQHKRPIRYHNDNTRRQIFRAYRKAQRKYNAPRAPGQTVQEHINKHPALQEMGEIVDIAAYRPQSPDKSLLARVKKWLKTSTQSREDAKKSREGQRK
ncbi:MAG: transglutaminase-like domain-containing protein, partial [Aggregatilineales bacterium]